MFGAAVSAPSWLRAKIVDAERKAEQALAEKRFAVYRHWSKEAARLRDLPVLA